MWVRSSTVRERNWKGSVRVSIEVPGKKYKATEIETKLASSYRKMSPALYDYITILIVYYKPSGNRE